MANKQCTFNKIWLDSKIFPEFSGWLAILPQHIVSGP